MAAFSGTAGSVVLVGTAGTVVGGISEWSFDGSMSPVETTEFGATFDTYVPSVRNVTGSFSGNKDNSNTTQLAVQTAWINGSAISLSLYENGTKYWSIGTAYITSMGNTVGVKGKGEATFSFQGSGPATYT